MESYLKKERTGSGLSNAKKKGMKKSKKRGDGGRVIGGRGAKCNSPCLRCLSEEGGRGRKGKNGKNGKRWGVHGKWKSDGRGRGGWGWMRGVG